MNYKSLLSIVLSLFFLSCTPSPEEEAQALVEKSIEAHELSKKWENVAAIRFKKLTRLLDEDGAVESESEQWVEFRLKPYFEAKLTWAKDSISHIVNFNGSKMSYQMGENSIQNEGFLKVKKAEIDAAYFSFAQPWMLADEDVNLIYEGQKTLEKGELAESIRIELGLDSESKWIYFDPNSARIVAAERHTKGQNNLIETISYDETSGLLLAKEQKVFKLDGNGNTQFSQAEYLYSDYQVTFE
ncbi:hypothetical protein SAMN04489724_2454 [Algoriphagus locisalis]|uniref:Outer membrane lipoprotein-sorting protein n=1 Tax=Algoriphagus locisalis TaxID=305507 RepID=A0A1I7BIG2_9BACT|nr:hypothetical protein [Algoriphagus locisalis]SFT86966.1 hypothetical protein SAMN04489724_2454 [Algoriphagus locisalis]